MVKPYSEVRKGDVVWAPYRRDPLWPALVRNSYPKKITYIFFPLPSNHPDLWSKKVPTFSCHPKAVRALTLNDVLPSKSTTDLKEAYNYATQYLKERELTRGSAAPLYYVGAYSREMGSVDNSILDDSIDTYDDMPQILDDNHTDTGSAASTSGEKSCLTEESPPRECVELPERDKTSTSRCVVKRKHSAADDPPCLAKRQPLSQSSLDSSTVAADSTTQSDSWPSPDVLAPTIFREATYILERVWATDLVQNYVTPPRSSMRFETCTGNLLTDHETDSLFDLIFTWVRERERNSYFLPGVHLVMNVLMPEVIIQALEIASGLSRDVAERMVRRTPSESSSSSTSGEINCNKCRGIASNNGLHKCGLSLDELARVACRERESITE
ncbi:hypothetical protein KIN20_006378 [Parelaphostrongylus tenuis]|uniref:PWWP domain-containing protein n=1 Tax=Parelaphostrongylus tenuis TaxID=148309 RepID=A0AAD5MU16_PARTN|nr:hypothetical protein KIN20_006378 [Parelaphostrongylus tenuis]